MRIALVHSGGTLWLAGNPALAERLHPSAGNLRMDGRTATQADLYVGGDETVHTDRGNLATTVTFETSRIFATVAEAEVWSGLYDSLNPRAGTLVGVGIAGLVESLVNWPGAVVQPPRREVNGCSVMLSYEVLCGLPEAAAWASGWVEFGYPSVNFTITVNGTVYTSTTALTPDPPLFNRSPAGFVAAINATYSGTANPDVVASLVDRRVTLTARTAGTAGNAITLAETSADVTISGGTLTGGLGIGY